MLQILGRYFQSYRMGDVQVKIIKETDQLSIFALDRNLDYQLIKCNLNYPNIAIKWNINFLNQQKEFYIYKPSKNYKFIVDCQDQFYQLKEELIKLIPISSDLVETYPNLQKLSLNDFQNIQLGINVKTNQEQIVKQLFLQKISLQQELQNQTQINKNPHRNLLCYINHHVQGDSQYISMEHCKHGPLSNLYSKQDLPLELIRNIMQQTLCGISCLHDMQIIHRDIKSDNILISNLDDIEIKICDFGLSYHGLSYDVIGGTTNYMAPEVEAGQIYTNKCDIYSTGRVFLELLLGYKLGKKTNGFYIQEILNKREKEEGILEALDLIKQMLQEDPNLRFSAEDCLSHELFMNNSPFLNQQREQLNQQELKQKWISDLNNLQ